MIGDILKIIRNKRSLFFCLEGNRKLQLAHLSLLSPVKLSRKKQCSLCAQYATHCIIHIAIHFNSFKTQQMEDKKDIFTWICEGREQGRAETFGGAGAQSIKGAHGARLLIGLCSLLICVSKWMLLYWYSSKCHDAGLKKKQNRKDHFKFKC